MKQLPTLAFLMAVICLCAITTCVAQTKSITGYYGNRGYYQLGVSIQFKEDSTFIFTSGVHPIFYTDLDIFREEGKWSISGDTVILNPQASPETNTDIDLQEEEVAGDECITVTFKHVKRYFDSTGKLYLSDTVHIDDLAFALNGRRITRVATHCPHRNIPFRIHLTKEMLTKDDTVAVSRPKKELNCIYIGCYEAQQTNRFLIRNPKSTRFSYTVYSNYHRMPTLRQQKLLIKNNKTLCFKQPLNGSLFHRKWSKNRSYRIKRFTPNKTMLENYLQSQYLQSLQ